MTRDVLDEVDELQHLTVGQTVGGAYLHASLLGHAGTAFMPVPVRMPTPVGYLDAAKAM